MMKTWIGHGIFTDSPLPDSIQANIHIYVDLQFISSGKNVCGSAGAGGFYIEHTHSMVANI